MNDIISKHFNFKCMYNNVQIECIITIKYVYKIQIICVLTLV
jgi:hypothetical protein